MSALKEVGRLWGAYFDKDITSEDMHAQFDRIVAAQDKAEGGRALFGAVLLMHMARPSGVEVKEIDFGRIVNSQTLVMLFAHLDAFMGDSLRTICRVRPEVLKSGKTMQWSDIVACGTWEKLIEQLIEEYVFAFGLKPIGERVQGLKDRIGLEFTVAEASLRLLQDAEDIRHIVMHNGGNVSQDYLNRSHRGDVALGQLVPVSLEFVREVRRQVDGIGFALFEAIGKKFFGQTKVYSI